MKTTKELFEIIKKYLESNFYFADERYGSVLSLYVLSTWIYNLIPTLGYLAITGDVGTGKTTLGNILSKVVYNCSRTGNVSPGALFRTIDQNPGTVIVDEGDIKFNKRKSSESDILKMLNMGFHAGSILYRAEEISKGKFIEQTYKTFCPKIILTRALDDMPIKSRCIQIPLKSVGLRELSTKGIAINQNNNKLDLEVTEILEGLTEWTQNGVENLILVKWFDYFKSRIEQDRTHESHLVILAIAAVVDDSWVIDSVNFVMGSD